MTRAQFLRQRCFLRLHRVFNACRYSDPECPLSPLIPPTPHSGRQPGPPSPSLPTAALPLPPPSLPPRCPILSGWASCWCVDSRRVTHIVTPHNNPYCTPSLILSGWASCWCVNSPLARRMPTSCAKRRSRWGGGRQRGSCMEAASVRSGEKGPAPLSP